MNVNTRIANRRYFRYFVDLRVLYQRKEIVVYTGLILSLFTIAFFGLFALRPTLITIAGLIRETQDKKSVNQKLQTKIDDLRQAQNNWGQISEFIPLANQALPQDPSLSQIIYQIEILAQRDGVTLSSLSFMPVDLVGKNPKQKATQTPTGLGEIGFDLTAKGEFENIKNFLDSLEKLRRLVVIDAFALNQIKTETQKIMNLSLTGKTFYYPASQEQ